jgi:hypothetical protein
MNIRNTTAKGLKEQLTNGMSARLKYNTNKKIELGHASLT